MWGLQPPPSLLPVIRAAGVRDSMPSPACPRWRLAVAFPCWGPNSPASLVHRFLKPCSFHPGVWRSGSWHWDVGESRNWRETPSPSQTCHIPAGAGLRVYLHFTGEEASKLPEGSPGMFSWSGVAGHTSVATSSKAAVFLRE